MIIITIALIFSFTLIGRVFYLQIIKGSEYLEDYTMSILKEKTISATRGSIYDRNGNLLAYDKLAYSVNFEDTGDYTTDSEMNEKLKEVIDIIESNGDQIDDDFEITLSESGDLEFNVSGSTLNRFLADVYGHTYTTDLGYNDSLGYDEASATAQQVFDYMCDKYGIITDSSDGDEDDTVYDTETARKLVIVRYAMAANAYQKYIETTIASDVSEETVAQIEENSADILGVSIAEDTVRVYNNSEYFAHIIGYTGTISDDEYEELSQERDDYSLTDVVGKSGIEQYMETSLQGTKGTEEVYVDNVGTVLEVADSTEPEAGDDVYLTIDSELQMTVYDLLEEELAKILYSKITNVDDYDVSSVSSSSDIIIPIKDVYFALINNNVIDIETFSDDDAGTNEKAIYSLYQTRESEVLSLLSTQLTGTDATIFSECDDALEDYETYVMTMLYNNGVVDKSSIDTTSDEYTAWKEGTCTLQTYIQYLISCNLVDTSYFELTDKYADLSEIYSALMDYVEDELLNDNDFHKLVYEYMIEDDVISGTQICLVLYEQGVLTDSGSDVSDLSSGTTSAYEFIKNKIKNLEITPAQLALDPCNASCVIVDPNDGEVLACVTYPGYDNNKLANSVDSDYYAILNDDLSYPLLNYATQQKTAPGSTFKMVTATAALTEGFLSSAEETIEDLGEFTSITPSPTCWIYPDSTHGTINVSQALDYSCNYFFYELGYRMATSSGTYNDEDGLSVLSEYASAYGLNSNTGIEISEAEPEISDEDAVRSAIGQGTNNYTTSELARYVATVANSGTCYNLSLISKVTDTDGNVLSQFEPSVYNTLDNVSSTTWDAIHYGMRLVVEDDLSDIFSDFEIAVAGKTGTAQEVSTRPNHALFVCYAPYDDPEISIATRIPYGYTSANAAEITSYILEYYFDLEDADTISDSILNGTSTTYVGD